MPDTGGVSTLYGLDCGEPEQWTTWRRLRIDEPALLPADDTVAIWETSSALTDTEAVAIFGDNQADRIEIVQSDKAVVRWSTTRNFPESSNHNLDPAVYWSTLQGSPCSYDASNPTIVSGLQGMFSDDGGPGTSPNNRMKRLNYGSSAFYAASPSSPCFYRLTLPEGFWGPIRSACCPFQNQTLPAHGCKRFFENLKFRGLGSKGTQPRALPNPSSL
jgi:hypothetical protein